MPFRRLMYIVAAATLLLGLIPVSGSVRVVSASDKIAARAWSETAQGGTTEALVVLSEQADLNPAYALATKDEKGRFVVDALRAAARSQGPVIALLEARGIPYQSFYIVNMIKVTGDRKLMLELAARADVKQIDANPYVRVRLPVPTGVDSKQAGAQTVEWNVDRVNAPDVWALGYRGEGRVVADADTGADWDHPSMKNQYRGWDGVNVDHNYNWHDATSQDSPTPVDGHSHGTFTTSQMIGDDGGVNQIGVAPGAEWIACRNMDASGTGSLATYTECFEWLIAPYPIGGDPSEGDPAYAPDAVNNSWYCPASEGCSDDALRSIVEAVRAAGIFPSLSAGNSGSACSTVNEPPAIYNASYSVGATTSSDTIASFSSRGRVTVDGSNRIKPDVSAPGENIRGAVPGTGYQSGWSGTSMAAPHVTGGVALLWQAKPQLIGDINATESNLNRRAVPKLTSLCGSANGRLRPNNVYGWGILDLYAAVTAP